MNNARAFAVVALVLLVGVSQSAIAASKTRHDAAVARGDYWTMWERATPWNGRLLAMVRFTS